MESFLFCTTVVALILAIIYMVKSCRLKRKLSWRDEEIKHVGMTRDSYGELYLKECSENSKLRAIVEHKNNVIGLRNTEIKSMKSVIDEVTNRSHES